MSMNMNTKTLLCFLDMATEMAPASSKVVIQQAKDLILEAHKSGFITDAGKVRKVLGTLPVTADGAIATINGTFYTPPDDDPDGECGMAAWAEGNAPVGHRLGFRVSYFGADRTWNSQDCYSTPEAAEAARGEK